MSRVFELPNLEGTGFGCWNTHSSRDVISMRRMPMMRRECRSDIKVGCLLCA